MRLTEKAMIEEFPHDRTKKDSKKHRNAVDSIHTVVLLNAHVILAFRASNSLVFLDNENIDDCPSLNAKFFVHNPINRYLMH